MDATEPDETVNLHRHLARIYNHLGDAPLGMSGKVLPERLHCRGKDTLRIWP